MSFVLISCDILVLVAVYINFLIEILFDLYEKPVSCTNWFRRIVISDSNNDVVSALVFKRERFHYKVNLVSSLVNCYFSEFQE